MRLALIGFALGTALLQLQPTLPTETSTIGLGAAGLALLLGAARVPLPWLRPALSAGGAVLLGLAWAALCANARLADTLPDASEGRDLVLAGTIASLPQPFDRGVRFEFEVDDPTAARVPRHIQVTWYSSYAGAPDRPVPIVHAGERWKLVARLRKPHGNANPHGFDYEAWLLERGIRATGYVRIGRDNAAPERLDAFTWSMQSVVDRMREHIRARLQSSLGDAPYGGVIVALAIGDQRAIDNEQWQIFARTGVSHLMSISGLHVTMVASLAGWLIFALWRQSVRYTPRLLLMLPAPQAAALGGFLTALTYCLLAGFQVPAQRTLYMLGVAAWAIWRGWFGSATRVLALALAVVALLDPWAALSAGFWLSFGAVALLLLTGQAAGLRAHWLRTALTAQAAITIGLLPLTLVLFQQVSLVGPLANAVAIPLVSLVITPLALAAAIFPIDALAHLAHGLQQLLMIYLEWLGRLPFAVWQHAAPPWPLAALAAVGALWMFVPWWWSWRVLGLAWMLPLFLYTPPPPEAGDVRVTVLDVGQGLAVVARTREHTLLFDTGPAYSPEADGGNRVVLPYLRGEGVERLDGMVVSHDDSDHSGGALSVLSAVPVGWMASPLQAKNAIAQAAGARARRCIAGQAWEWDGVRFEFLHPAPEDYVHLSDLPDNAQSCVLKITAHGHGVLLPADIERDVEARLPASALKSEVLVAPHHGSQTSSSPRFIAAVAPATVVFPVGYRNRFRHPAPEVVERYRESGAQLLRTDSGGAVMIDIDAGGARTRLYRETQARYWYGR
ncbi:MAG TPA: DNA internalization-related competence protein ComEC/Rec2 [Burkholderiales bacterium]